MEQQGNMGGKWVERFTTPSIRYSQKFQEESITKARKVLQTTTSSSLWKLPQSRTQKKLIA